MLVARVQKIARLCLLSLALVTPTAAQLSYLKASNTDAADSFGCSVSLSGDTLVVGARFEDSSSIGVNGNATDNSAAESGAVYVFVQSGTTWAQEAYLKASNAEAGDRFGASVSISGDTLVVGAHLEDSSATGVGGNQANNGAFSSGAAYVFVRSGTTWSQQAYLKASNTDAEDQFGQSVAIDGDSLIVGAWREDSNATGIDGNQADDSFPDAGASHVFTRSGVAWMQTAYLKATNTDSLDELGQSVAISGSTAVAGARGEDSNAIGVNGDASDNSSTGAGAAYAVELAAAEIGTNLCSGDGGNQMGCTNCPCLNNAAVGTIGGCLNSATTSARLVATGDTSVSLPSGSTSDLRFALTGAPPSACGPPAGIAQAGAGLVAGQTRYFQVIHRDDALLSCMRGLNTSQAVEITFTP